MGVFLIEKVFMIMHKNVIIRGKQCMIHYPAKSRQKRRLNKYEK